MVNTEQTSNTVTMNIYYNILNIVVNTELITYVIYVINHYNILNIVVNTERVKGYKK